jgi:lysozyme family protein
MWEEIMRLEKFFKEMLKNEGGYSNDPHDSGGKTFWGITINNFPNAYKEIKHLHDEGQTDLARLTAMSFYRRNFYNPLYDEIQDIRLAFRVFDFGVNTGVKSAVRILQRCVNKFGFRIADDGIFGKETLRTVNEVGDPLYRAYEIAIEGYYKSLKTFWRFGRGWLNRLFRNPFK